MDEDKKRWYTYAIRCISNKKQDYIIPCNSNGIHVSNDPESAIEPYHPIDDPDKYEIITLDITNLVEEKIITKTINDKLKT